jgi:hypothetical protein
MHSVGCGDKDRVDICRGAELGCGGEGVLDAELACGLASALSVLARQCRDFAIACVGKSGHEALYSV